jgi:hypothetical protein
MLGLILDQLKIRATKNDDQKDFAINKTLSVQKWKALQQNLVSF